MTVTTNENGVEKLRVLHVMHSMHIGGAERAVYQLIRLQRERGIAADLFVMVPRGEYAMRVSKLPGAVVHTLPMSLGNPLSLVCAGRCFAGYDIVHFHFVGVVAMLPTIWVRGPALAYTHRGGRHSYPLKRRLAYQACGAAIRRWFHGISGNTQFAGEVAAEMFSLPRGAVVTTYNGIDCDLLAVKHSREEILGQLGADPAVPCIGTTANLRAWKRVDLLIDALGKLGTQDWHCVIVGDGPDRRRLEKMVAERGLTGRVRFPGKQVDIADWLQVMDIFVLPSDSLESFGNSAVEAMCMGVPVIVMEDSKGLLEHVANGAGLIAKDSGEIASHIEMLLGDAAMRRETGEKGRDAIRKRYTYEASYAAYNELYRKTLAARKSKRVLGAR